jgi:CRP-like cAMP-binding protein
MNPENPSEEPSRVRLALRRSSLFSSLSDEVLTALEAQLTHLTLISGEVLFREGDPSDSLYIVISGRLLVSQVAPVHAQHTSRALATCQGSPGFW